MKKLLLGTFVLQVLCASAQYASLPITLSLPYDKDTIEEKEPTFMWQTNLTTIQNDVRISQALNVVEINANQTATEAIVENPSLLYREGILSTSFNYPSSNKELEEGHRYAWQIIYLFNGMVVQQSDVWEFILAKKTPPTRNFVVVKSKNDGSILQTQQEELNVLTTETGTLDLMVTVTNSKGVSQKAQMKEWINGELVENTVSEQNNQTRYFTLNYSDLDLKPGVYTFEWKAKKGTLFTQLFRVD